MNAMVMNEDLSIDDEHGIAIRSESVFLLDSYGIGLHCLLITAERSRHHQQG